VAERLFRVAEVFYFRAGITVIAADCPITAVPVRLRVGDLLEFRNPDGIVFRCPLSSIEFASPPDPQRPFGFALPCGTSQSAVQQGAEVWWTQEADASGDS
jgi:hypothetical protein